MFNRMIVQEALKRGFELDDNPGWSSDYPDYGQDSLISQLIHDVFGGEILKTRMKKGWHFYNRIDGEIIDLTRTKMGKYSKKMRLEDIPSDPGETHNYFTLEDYSTFFMSFVKAFEEAVGLDKYKHGLSV